MHVGGKVVSGGFGDDKGHFTLDGSTAMADAEVLCVSENQVSECTRLERV
jgi:hypothetical protein